MGIERISNIDAADVCSTSQLPEGQVDTLLPAPGLENNLGHETDRFENRITFFQLRFNLLAPGDVEAVFNHLNNISGRVDDGLAVKRHMALAAIRQAETLLEHQRLTGALDLIDGTGQTVSLAFTAHVAGEFEAGKPLSTSQLLGRRIANRILRCFTSST